MDRLVGSVGIKTLDCIYHNAGDWKSAIKTGPNIPLRQCRDLLKYLLGQIGLKSEIANYLEIN